MIRTQFSATIKPFGLIQQYLSHTLCDYLAAQGTLPQYSCPGVSKQNGVVERKHLHTLEMARSLLLFASVPSTFWAEAIHTAVFLINRMPSRVLVNLTPFEWLFTRPPSYYPLCVLGCTCFVLLPLGSVTSCPLVQPRVFFLATTKNTKDIVVMIWLLAVCTSLVMFFTHYHSPSLSSVPSPIFLDFSPIVSPSSPLISPNTLASSSTSQPTTMETPTLAPSSDVSLPVDLVPPERHYP